MAEDAHAARLPLEKLRTPEQLQVTCVQRISNWHTCKELRMTPVNNVDQLTSCGCTMLPNAQRPCCTEQLAGLGANCSLRLQQHPTI
jgi:hypothetical protein